MSATVSTFSAEDVSDHLGELGALLHACVHDGASIGFVLPYAQSEAEAFWRDKVLPGVTAGSRIMLVARREGSPARCSSAAISCPTSRTAPTSTS